MIGKTVAHYEILAKLGEGGMGVVYRALDTRLDRHVAIKFLPRHLQSDPDSKKRFIQEARAASALEHPNICAVYEIGETPDGELYIVMPSYEGQSLEERINDGPMRADDALELVIQVASGLAKAHGAGIVHRDIKPCNIYVTGDGHAKILDFGLAKFAGQTQITRAGTMVGTVPYMSPEQARGEEVGASSDVFSVGAVFYQLLTGRLPFDAEHDAAVLYKIMNESPAPLTRHRSELGEGFQRVIDRALAKDRETRYRDSSELLADLQRLRSGTEITPVRRKSRRTRLAIFAALGLSVVAIGVLMYSRLKDSGPTATSVTARSIAVMPFADMSENNDQEYFADGLAEELLGLLSKVPTLKVAGRTSSFYFKGKQATTAEIASTLGVTHLLEGSVRKSGDRLRVSAQLVRAEDGFQLWSETFDRKLDDVFKVQDEIAGAVVQALELKLLDADMPRASATHSQEAYALFLQARALHSQGTHATNVTGISYLERAVKLDPNFAPAWFGLGDALVFDYAVLGYGTHEDIRRRAGEAAETALRLDPNLADAHLLMGRVLGELDWNWPAADRELQRALELDPNNSLLLWVMSYYALIGGRADEALQFAERVVALDPISYGSYYALGDVLWGIGRQADAEAAYRKATELSPKAAGNYFALGMTLLRQGRFAEALAAIEQETHDGYRLYGLAVVNDALGRRAEADSALAELEATGANGHAWSIGSIHACRKEVDQAFSWLERAYRQHEGMLPYIGYDQYYPCVDVLRRDPRYAELRKKLNLPPE